MLAPFTQFGRIVRRVSEFTIGAALVLAHLAAADRKSRILAPGDHQRARNDSQKPRRPATTMFVPPSSTSVPSNHPTP